MTRWFNPTSLHFPSSSWSHSPFRTKKHRPSSHHRQVQQYRLLYELARGSTCIVYLALDTKSKKLYAIKEMNKTRLQRQLCVDWLQSRHPKQQEQRQTDGSKRRRIDSHPGPPALTHCTESDLLQSLHHPYLVEWIDYFEDSHNMYLVTEWVSGTVLVDLHNPEAKPVDASQWHSIFTQLVALLDYLHKKDIIHGDIKPDNILLTKDHQIKLIDFGSAIHGHEKDGPQRHHTPAFSPPECPTSSQPAADIWSLGMTLYCMVYGKLPYNSPTSPVHQQIATLTTIPHDDTTVDPRLCHLIDQMLTLSPSDRITLDQIKRHPWFLDGTCASPIP